MVFSRARQHAVTLAAFVAACLRRPTGRRDSTLQLLDLPPELLDDIPLPQNVQERLQQEREIQKRSLHIFLQR